MVPNTQIPYGSDYVRIISAICNRYPRPLARQKQKRILPLRWRCCIYLANWTNFEFDWNRGNRPTIMYVDKTYRLRWGSRVPSISEVETRLITLGTYQIKIAKSYTYEHIKEDGSYEIHVNEDIDSARIQSRHISAKKYYYRIHCGEGVVLALYCKCKAGSRVVGCNAHIFSVFGYLSYARH